MRFSFRLAAPALRAARRRNEPSTSRITGRERGRFACRRTSENFAPRLHRGRRRDRSRRRDEPRFGCPTARFISGSCCAARRSRARAVTKRDRVRCYVTTASARARTKRANRATGRPRAPQPLPPAQRVGFAIVGLGELSIREILPAFGQSQKARLAALVSGEPDKANTLARKHGIGANNVYSYANFDRWRDDPTVDVVLPNALHEEYVIRAARADKHVLCEKPMSTSSESAARMIQACAQANRHLMIVYRIQ